MAEIKNPPELLLKEVISSYPYLKDEAPSSWIVWSDNPEISALCRTQLVCHADMRWHKAGYDHLVTAFPRPTDHSLRYIRMMISGPFRAFSDLISLKRSKDSYYLQVDDLGKWPANVLFNFCIASRAPIEFAYLFDRWMELNKAGFPEVLAFLLSYSTDGKPFKYKREFLFKNHMWLDPASDWKIILAGTPNLGCTSFKETPARITPTNSIWGKSEDYKKITTMSDVKVAEYFNVKLIEKPKERKEKPLLRDSVKFYAQAAQMAQVAAQAAEPGQMLNAVGQIQNAGMQGLNQIGLPPLPVGFNQQYFADPQPEEDHDDIEELPDWDFEDQDD